MEPDQNKRGPGRPKLDPSAKRGASLTASVTVSELAAFKAKALALGKPVAALARETLLAVLAVAVLSLAGCGAAQSGTHASTDTQTEAIEVAGALLHGIADVVGSMAEADARRTCGATAETPENASCLEGVAARWAPADAAIDTVHASLDAWLAGVGGNALDAVRNTIAAYEAMGTALAGLGVKVPALPDVIKQALEALGGIDIRPDAGTDSGA